MAKESAQKPSLTRREYAIEQALIIMDMASTPGRRKILSDLIDKAESGALKEPLPVTYAGINGSFIVYPDGRTERS